MSKRFQRLVTGLLTIAMVMSLVPEPALADIAEGLVGGEEQQMTDVVEGSSEEGEQLDAVANQGDTAEGGVAEEPADDTNGVDEADGADGGMLRGPLGAPNGQNSEGGYVTVSGVEGTFATMDDAINAVKESGDTGEITYTVYGHVYASVQLGNSTGPDRLGLAPNGNETVNIVGGDKDAELTPIDDYHGLFGESLKKLNFSDIKLSDGRPAKGGESNDSWEFTYLEYEAEELTFNKVTFAEGTMIGGKSKATFTECTFKIEDQAVPEGNIGNKDNHYALWLADNANVTVDKCSFKDYAYGAIKGTYNKYSTTTELALTVTNSTFENCGVPEEHCVVHLDGATVLSFTGNTITNCYTEDGKIVNIKAGSEEALAAMAAINEDAFGDNAMGNKFYLNEGELTIDSVDNVTYTGEAFTPTPTVSRNGEAVDSKWIKYVYTDNTNAGTAKVTAYYGSENPVETTFKINPIKIGNYDLIVEEGPYTYTGSEIKPNFTLKDEDGHEVAISDDNFDVSYTNNVNAGTATVLVEGKKNYTKSVSARFDIDPLDLSKTTVEGLNDVTYNGKEQKQTPKVKLGDATVDSSVYKVTYAPENPTEAGEVTVTISPADGNTNVTGSKEAKYTITGAVAKIGDTYYASLNEAVAAAKEGDIVEILAADTYKLPNLPKNITIKGKVDGVVFEHANGGSVASIPNGATFENVTFSFGNVNYHGFQHAGVINMNKCTLNGKFFSYGDMKFTECTFNAPGTDASGVADKDYSMWAYAGNLTYTDCTFNGAGKFLNVYNESGATRYEITAEGCTFSNTGKANKAAFNVKETCGSKVLQYTVNINNCTTEGNFPEASEEGALKVISGLAQVDDRVDGGTIDGGEIVVNVDGEKAYSTPRIARVAAIGDEQFISLQDAINRATELGGNVTIDVFAGIVELPATAVIPEGVTIKGAGTDKTTLKITTTNGDGIKLTNPNITIQNLTIDGSAITSGGYKSLINVEADGCVVDNVVMTGGGKSTWNSSILVERLTADQAFTVKNSNISGSFRGVLRESCNANIVVENCEIDAIYPINIDGGNGGTVNVSGSKLHGWTSYSGIEKATFTNCEFSKGNSGYDCVAAYVDTEFDNCTFDSGFDVYAQTSPFDFTFMGCTKDSTPVTREDFKEQFPNDSDVWNKCDTYVDGKLVGAVAEVTDGTTTKEFKTLQAAVNAAHEMTGDVTVKLTADVAEVAVVHQKAGLNLTIDGAGKTITGQLYVDGDGRYNDSDTLTIKNIKFAYDSETYDDAYIDVPSTKTAGKVYTTGKYNYAHNLTVTGCEFAGEGATTVAVRVASGAGAHGVTISENTATSGHSFAQLVGVKDLTVTNNNVTGVKNGINISGGDGSAIISGNTLTANADEGYTVRVKDASSMNVLLEDNTFSGGEGVINQAKDASVTTITSGKYAGPLTMGNSGKIVISGGVFNTVPGLDQCADGVYPIANTDEATKADYPYTVGTAVALVDTLGYTNFADAAEAAVNDKVITLLADIADPYELPVENTLKVKLDGHALEVNAPEGSVLKTSGPDADGVTTYTIAGAVAKIDDTLFASLEDAIAAVPTDGTETTITMLANEAIDVTGYALTIPTSKNVVLDLNGKTVSGTCATGKSSALIRNLGTLTITDGAGEGQLTSTANPAWVYSEADPGGYASDLIRNEGTLVVYGGRLYNAATGSACYAIDNYSAGKITINGGMVDAAKASAIRLFYNNGGAIAVTGGTIGHYTSDDDYSYMGIQVQNGTNAAVAISGGTIAGYYALYSNGTDNSSVVISDGSFDGYVGFGSTGPSDISISGGEFTAWVGTWGSQVDFITGGIYAYAPEAELCGTDVDGNQLYPIANSDEATKADFPYTVGKAVALVDGFGYVDFTGAVEAAGNDKVITLLADIADPYELPVENTLKVKLDGHALEVNAPEGSVLKTSGPDADGVTTYTIADAVARIDDTLFASLQDALEAAVDNDTITLLVDIDLKDASYTSYRIPVSKSVTIDGAGHAVTVAKRGFGVGVGASSNLDVTFKNMTITNNDPAARCIDTRGHIGSLSLENVTLDVSGASGNTQALTIGGNQSDSAAVNITGSTFKGNETAYSIITFNPVNMTIEDSSITGWSALYMKGPDGSAGSASSKVEIKNSNLTSTAFAGISNAFALVKMEDSNIQVGITDSKIVVDGTSNYQAIALAEDGVNNSLVTLGEGNKVTFVDEKAAVTIPGKEIATEVTAGLFNKLIPVDVCAEGLYPIANTDEATKADYPYTVGEAVAKIGDNYYGTLQSAIDAVPVGTDNATTIVLLKSTNGGYDIGDSAGQAPKSIVLDLGGNILTLGPAVGSTGTETNGLRVLANSKLEVKNGTVTNNDVANAQGKKVAFLLVNYGDMTLTDVTVTPDAQASLAINNRGALTLAGKTTVNNPTAINDYLGWPSEPIAITNDPYNYFYANKNATLTVDSADVVVGNVMAELYGNATNAGTVDFDISAGKFGTLYTDGSTARTVAGNVTGGLFKTAPAEKFCGKNESDVQLLPIPSGNADYPYTVGIAVASITKGDPASTSYFSTVSEAIEAAAEGDTIELLADHAEDVEVAGGKKLTLDLGGKTLTGYVDLYDADLTVEGGKLAGTVWANGSAADEAYGHFTLAEDATVEAGYGIVIYQADGTNAGYGQTVDINGTVNGNVWVMGNIHYLGESPSTVNVNATAKITSEEIGIALNGAAIVNVAEGAKITGTDDKGTGIEVRAGELNVAGGTITGEGTELTVTPAGSGTTTYGAGIAVAQHTTALPIEVNVTGGTVKGAAAISVANPEGNADNAPQISVTNGFFTGDVVNDDARVTEGFVSGGYYSNDTVDAFTVDGKNAVVNSDPETKDAYPFVIGEAVASVTTADGKVTNYTTLPAAVAAAKNGDTVKLLKDADGAGVMITSANAKDITIDFGGHTYNIDKGLVGSTGTESQAFHFEKGCKVTLKNGMLTSTNASMLVQNYCDLTVAKDMVLDGTQCGCGYVLSNNNGTVAINGTIKAAAGKNAFDVCWGPKVGYPDGAQVTLSHDAVINGNIELGTWGANDGTTPASKLTINGATVNGSINIASSVFTKDNLVINAGTFSVEPPTAAPTATQPATYPLGKYPVINAEGTAYTIEYSLASPDIQVVTSDEALSYTYTGSEIKPEVVVTVAGAQNLSDKNLAWAAANYNAGDKVAASNYVVTYDNNINVGDNTAKVTLTGTDDGDFARTATTRTFSITPASIENAEITVTGGTSYDYTSEEITPAVTVKLGDTTLSGETDYSVSYEENVRTGIGIITVTGKGNYTGTAKAEFRIHGTSINTATVVTDAPADGYTYDGTAKTPKVTSVKMTINGEEVTLKEGEDFTVNYVNNVNAGTAQIVLFGIADFSGGQIVEFKINKAKVHIPELEDGVEVTFTTSSFNGTVSYDGKQHDFLKDDATTPARYTIDRQPGRKDVGSYTVIAVLNDAENYVWADGINNSEPLAAIFQIVPAEAQITIGEIPAQLYTGSAIEPAVNVTTTPEGLSYKLEFTDNVEPGTAKVTATITDPSYEAATANKTFEIKSAVARIGGTYFATVSEAIEASAEGDTIELLADHAENVAVAGGKKLTLDLNGKTLTGSVDLYDADLTVEGGKLAGTVWANGSKNDEAYGHFTLAEDATVEAGYGIVIYQAEDGKSGFGQTVDIDGTVDGIVWVMGNITEAGENLSVINVNGTAKITGNDVGIGLNGMAVVNVAEGATVTGVSASGTGIEVRAGKLNVAGGAITGEGTKLTVTPAGSGTTTYGAGIAVAQHTTKLPIEVNVTGGTVKGVYAIYESDPQSNNDAANVKVTLSDGTFLSTSEDGKAVHADDKNVAITGGAYSDDEGTGYTLPEGKYLLKGEDDLYRLADNTVVAVPEAVEGLVYDGTEQTGVEAGEGYALEGNTATNAGTHTATATLAEHCVWTDGTTEPKTIDFSIAKAKATVTASDTSKVYNTADPESFAVKSVEGLIGEDKLAAGDYFIARAEGENVGTYAIVVTDAGTNANYAIEGVDGTFTITQAALPTAEKIADQLYTGEAQTPAVTIKDGERILVEDTDYTVVGYFSNTGLGEASAVVTGKGNYVGMQLVKFNIVESDKEALKKALQDADAAIVATSDEGGFDLEPRTKYVTSADQAALAEAIEAAQAVYDDPAATDAEVADATNALNEAVSAYNAKIKTAKAAVARIGSTNYTTLSAAINAVKGTSGQTIELLVDQSISGIFNRYKIEDGTEFTLDLGGKTLSANGAYFTVNGGAVTVTNGTINARGNNDGFFYMNGGELTIAEDATINGTSEVTPVCVFGPATVTTSGTLTAQKSFAIAGNGSAGKGGYTVNVTGGTVSASNAPAIYHPNSGTVTISGGEVTGTTAVYQKSGTLQVTGGKLTGNGVKADYTYNGNGANATGDAIVIDSCNYPGGAPVAAISGGEVISVNASAVGTYATEGNSPVAGFITNDSEAAFSDDNASTKLGVPAGKYLLKGEDGLYRLADLKVIGAPVAIQGLAYNGLTQTGVEQGEGYTLTGNTATVPGTYTATATLEEGYAWSDSEFDGKVNWGIAKGRVTVKASDASKAFGQDDPELTATVDGLFPADAIEYTVKRAQGENAGEYAITVSGEAEQGNYKVSYEGGTFTIEPVDVSGLTVGAIPAQTYTGSAIEPELTINYGENKLVEGTDYTVAFENNIETGVAKATITGTGNYTGTTTAYFAINEKSSGVTVEAIEDQAYTGEAIEPTLTVKDGEKTLAKGTDYDASFFNNVELGTATAVVTLKGNYEGGVTATFSIVAREATISIDPIESQAYTGEPVEPAQVKVSPEGISYEVVYANNVQPGTATVTATVTEPGYEAATATATFEIRAAVAETGGKYYESLQAAIDAAEPFSVVNLLASVTENVVTASDDEISIDLNGNTLSAKNGGVAITNNGILTIFDSADEAGTIEQTGKNYAISNHGPKLTIYTVNVTSTSKTNALVATGWYTPSDNVEGTYCDLVIESGNFVGGNYNVKVDDYGTATINWADFKNDAEANVLSAGKSLVINGGHFVATDNASVIGDYRTAGIDAETATIEINGGIFDYTTPYGTYWNYGDADPAIPMAVNGGGWADDALNSQPNAAEPQGQYLALSEEDGYYYLTDYAVVAVPEAVEGLVYDGTEQTGVEAGEGYTLTSNTATNAGAHTATATLAEHCVWSDGTYEAKEITFSIAKAAATVTAGSATRTYNTDNPALTATVEGTFGRDAISYTLATEATKTSPVGEYAITASGEAEQGNYVVTYEAGKLTVTKGTILGIAAIGDQLYTGSEIKPALTVTDINGNAVDAAGYDAMWLDNTELGEAAVILTGKGNYTGLAVAKFKIVESDKDALKKALEEANAAIVATSDQNGFDLEPGTDYVTSEVQAALATAIAEAQAVYDDPTATDAEVAAAANDLNDAIRAYEAEIYVSEAAVASIGDEFYTSLQAALDAAEDGDAVNLLTGTKESVSVADKSISIDLNGNTLASDGYALTVSGTAEVTVSNGTIDAGFMGANTADASTLTLGDGLTIDSDVYGVYPAGGSTLNVEGAEIHGVLAISTNGSKSQGVTINVNSGTISGDVADSDSYSAGIYLPAGTLNVNGGIITGNEAAIVQRGGTVTVSGGELSYTNDDAAHHGSIGDRRNAMPVGVIVIDAETATNYPAAASAKTEVNAPAVLVAPEGGSIVTGFADGDTARATLNEGVVTSLVPVDESIAEGCYAADNDEGRYVITAKTIIDAPVAIEGIIYDGNEQTGVEEGEGYTLTGNTATEAGDYTATATLEKGYAWSDSEFDGTIKWSIAEAVAEIDGTYYASLQDAVDAAYDGATITMLADEELDAQVVINKDVLLNLNGKKLYNDENDPDIFVGKSWSLISVQGGNLTINGDGTLKAKDGDSYALDVRQGGSLTIVDGTFVGNITAVYVHDGSLYIEGGNYDVQQLDSNKGKAFMINCRDDNYLSGDAVVDIVGGYFNGWNPSDNAAEPGGHTDFTPEGYTGTLAEGETDVWTVKSQKLIVYIEYIETQAYTGEEIKPAVTVYDEYGDVIEAKDENYTVTYADNIKAGTATVTVTATDRGDYYGSAETSFVIEKGALADADVVFDPESYVFDGTAKEPSVTVTLDGETLTEGTDYKVTYSDNTNAGTANVTIEAVEGGKYDGVKGASFTIAKADIANATVKASDKTYDGTAKTIDSVTLGDYTLTEGTDYVLVCVNNVNVGTATAILAGKGNFEGIKSVEFKIVETDKSALEQAIEDANDALVSVSDEKYGSDLDAGTEYTTSDDKQELLDAIADAQSVLDDPKASAAEVAAAAEALDEAVEKYEASIKEARKIKITTIAPIENQPYTGKAIEPELKVTDEDGDEVAPENYTATYENNTEAGTAKVTVTATGKAYAGTAETTFVIENGTLADADVALDPESYVFDGTAKEPSVNVTLNGETLTEGTDYKVTYSANTNAGTANVTIEAVEGGKYDGVKGASFTIDKASIADATITATDKTYDGTAKKIDSAKLGDYTLTEGTDYDVTYINNVEAGTAVAIITGKGNLDGMKVVTFNINEPTGVDKSALEQAIEAAQSDEDGTKVSEDGKDVNTDEQWVDPATKKALDDAIAEANEVLNNPDATQDQVDQAVADLKDAQEAFDEAKKPGTPDKSALEQAIEDAKADRNATEVSKDGKDVDPSDEWVPQSVKDDLQTAIAAAQAVLNDPDATVEEIAAATEAMKDAQEAFDDAKNNGTKIGDISDATIGELSNETYTGEAFEPEPEVKMGEKTLVKDTDYTLSYEENVNTGTATVTVTGKGNYSGTNSATFEIEPAELTAENVAPIAQQPYTGAAVEPEPEVTFNGKTLEKGTDYEVAWSNNEVPGEATCTVTGKGNFTGTVEAKFDVSGVRWQRYGGATAYDTAKLAVEADGTFAEGRGGTVIVASTNNYTDALSATGLAGTLDAPVLITHKSKLTEQTAEEIQRLQPSRVIVVGSEKKINANAFAQIQALVPNVTRVSASGAENPASTSVALWRAGSGWGRTAVIATCEDRGFKDALSIAPFAWAKKAPIFMVDASTHKLTKETLNALKAGGFNEVVIVGGTSVVDASVEDSVERATGVSPLRLAGRSGLDTSAEIAKWELTQGMGVSHISVATNQGYRDAITSAAVCGKNNSVLVLANPNGTKSAMRAFDAVYDSSKLVHGHVLGGEAALSTAVWNYVNNA